ncbi:ThuA domain-containing protein [Cellulophaga sp. F20128]|uniref:ThuA domain-containing protein n=1 Tax=Cellulophaga sp. F20128 TaxID=2926413 RepID=UPI001FF5193B|nr:ThuA domain-containing protein [Cellulophaga sp. F20128]MCK0156929.1 ThuA domain-containing protein [Cellulophaga sp. F20128]
MKTSLLLVLLFAIFSSFTKKEDKVLVFSKTEGFRHGAIEAGIASLKKMGKEKNFTVVATEDAAFFTKDVLETYAAVIFLNTTGDILNDAQQVAFENYIKTGGGFVGVHAATDTEYDWPWYNKLVGAYFLNHPKQQEATLTIVDKKHRSTKMLGDTWQKFDEWYNFKDINPDINVLIEIDESSYEGGKNGAHHPMSWYHNYDGGRAFYTGMGHTDETFGNPKFLEHLYEGIKYAMGHKK